MQILTYAGFFLVLHAGYSCAHWRWIVGDRVNPGTPYDVYVEVFLGFIAVIMGALLTAGEFKPIQTSASSLSKGPSPDFYVYSHRTMANKRLDVGKSLRKKEKIVEEID